MKGDVEAAAVANADRIAQLQGRLGIDVERSVQASWLATGTTGDILTWFYAVGYWPSIVAAVAAAAVRDRRLLSRLGVSLALSGAAGLVVITTFPLAPPRLVGGADDHVARSEFLSRLAGVAVWCVPALMSVAVVTTGNHWASTSWRGRRPPPSHGGPPPW